MKHRKEIKSYDGYVDILDRVRGIVRAELGAHYKTQKVLKEINAFEDEITAMLDGRYEDMA